MRLQKGDSVGICAPAKRIDYIEIEYAIDVLQSWGLKVKLGETIGKGKYLFAGTDEERRADFQQLLDDPEVNAIFSARGGYGCVKIIDDLDFTALNQQPKWLIGFSDFTVFHCHIFRHFNWPTLHASMPVFFPNNSKAAINSLKKVLFDGAIQYKINSPFPELCLDGEAEGKIIGGNLSVIYSLCGSDSGLKTNKYILFLEDLCEYFYHVDRMMENLKRNGIFEQLSAVIVGSFTDMKDGALPYGSNAYEILFSYFKQANIPVFTGFPAGHTPDNRPLIFGQNTRLSIEKSCLNLSQ